MAITNRDAFPYQFDKTISKIFFDGYLGAPSEFDKIFKVQDAPKGRDYTEAELSPLGELRELGEGEGVTFDIPEEGHKKTIGYTKYGLGFQYTAEMIKDDLFGHFKRMPQKLAKSAAYKRETVAFDLFNRGFTFHTSWDGKYIFATDHQTLKSGTVIANEPTTAGELSETTLQAAFEYYDNLVDEAGMPLVLRPSILMVPMELKYTATKLMKQELQIGTANNDLNIANPSNNILDSYRLHVGRHLTSATAWFLLSEERDNRYLWKEQFNLKSADDFYTDNALFKTVGRFGVFAMDYKGMYGNPGA